MPGLAALLSRLDPDPLVRGRQFERICKWFLQNDPRYASQLRQVWLWAEWPGRYGPDTGIDLVAEQHDAALWAIQAKCREPSDAIAKAEVDSFLAESSRPDFAYRLLIATTDHVGVNARRTLEGQEKRVGFVLRSDLEAAIVRWPKSPADLLPRRLPWRRLRPHQRDAVLAVTRGFRSAERGRLVMACGTGKTRVGLACTERLRSERTLVLVPSLLLISQTLREWYRDATRPFRALLVCSDREAGSGADSFAPSVSELGLQVTLDPARIAAFLSEGEGQRVIFCTYQSSPLIAEAQALGGQDFDLAIADEAHRCAGREAATFATILDPSKIRAQRRLFMTATPRYYTGRVRRLAHEAEDEVASMDDEARFGPLFHRLAFGEAIARGLLADYRVVVIGVSDPRFLELAERGSFVRREATATDARTLATQIGVARAISRHDLRRVVSFHSRVDLARSFARGMNDLVAWLPEDLRPGGSFSATYVAGDMDTGERNRRLHRLRRIGPGERMLLTNARCLQEGVDLPELDGVVFVDPRRSQVDIVQAVGRAIRKGEGKVGTVVVPVFVAEGADPAEALEGSAFEPVWAVLKALRAHDEELAEALDSLRRGLGERGVLGWLPSKIALDFGPEVGPEFAWAFDAKLVAETTASWEFAYGLLLQFVERQGHARVPQSRWDEGFHLGGWVAAQRVAHKAGRMAPERRQRLEALNGWTWRSFDTKWERGLAALLRFAGREGHARVPMNHSEDGLRLGVWVQHQRLRFKRGRMTPERAAALEEVPGWEWTVAAPRAPLRSWEAWYRALTGYSARTGTARIPVDRVEDDLRLGQWAAEQRKRYRRGKVLPARVALLEGLPGWTWLPPEESWEAGFQVLKAYATRTGQARPPFDHVEDGFALGRWVSRQRREGRAGTLAPSRRGRLGALPGWAWEPGPERWEAAYARLSSFVAREGHARVPQGWHEDGFALGTWLSNQRHRHGKGGLEPHREARLAALSGWTWDQKRADWDDGLDRLSAYVERVGNARVPQEYEDQGFPLGQWVAVQRRAFKRSTLDPAHAARLEAIPGWTWNQHEADWHEAFRRLELFVAQHGTAQVSARHVEGGFRLGAWVSDQRDAFRRDELVANRKEALESLPGWTWQVFDRQWEDNLGRLRRFAARTGELSIPLGHREDGIRLDQWVAAQRRAYRDGTLDPDRAASLEAMPGWEWNPAAVRWEEGFASLEAFVAREGHALVPQRYQEAGFALGQWVSVQRKAFKDRKLEADRRSRLEGLPRWTWAAGRDSSSLL